MTIWLIALSILLLVAISAFFSGSETALTATSKARMMLLEKSGDRRARIVSRLIADRESLIGAILLGNNVVNILASALATSVFLSLFGQAGVAYATIVMTLLVLVFGEILPKTLAIGSPDRVSRAAAPVLSVVVAVFSPIVSTVQILIRGILHLVGWNASDGKAILTATDEIRGQVDLLHAEGSVVKDERDRLGGLLDLGELDVSDVMVHRTNMHTVNAAESSDKIVDDILASPYTRVPIWEGEPENIIGVIHSKDLLRILKGTGGDTSDIDVRAVAKRPWFVPDTTALNDQLNAFLKRKAHFALVVDEYGEVQGLITLEDIIEEIVGEIADEHDLEIQGVRPQPDGSVNADGSVPIRDLNRVMDWDLPDEAATTIAGLVIHEARIIPEPGQAFTFHGFRFQVLRRSRNRLTALRITPLKREDRSPAPA
ncbi:HlyC/CorC family transporter [Bauldia sp.]|uniref:HlyC/CorC family transporter n=1 Tax=Bauldia sp. TaxID=2575872 RepID=UPI003BABB28B